MVLLKYLKLMSNVNINFKLVSKIECDHRTLNILESKIVARKKRLFMFVKINSINFLIDNFQIYLH